MNDAGEIATCSAFTTAFRVRLSVLVVFATIVVEATVIDSGVPDPSALANVRAVNGTFVPGGNCTLIVQLRPPDAAVQFGELAPRPTTDVPAVVAIEREFVALET